MIEGRCGWCAEPIEQAETGRPRQFCDDNHRVAYARRKATMPPTWDRPGDPPWEPINQAEEEALRRYDEAHPPPPPHVVTEEETKKLREENRRILRSKGYRTVRG